MNLETLQVMNVLNRSLDAYEERHRVITNNIANVDVPNYKRKDVRFESDLQRALHPEPAPRFIAKKIRASHVGFGEPKNINFDDVTPQIEVEMETDYRNDGSNVDPDHEMMELQKNAQLYRVVSSRVGGMFKMINEVIRKGGER